MKKYEFRKYNLYEEWFVVEAKDKEEAEKKVGEMGEDDIETSKFVGQEGETELYRTTDLGDDDEVELPRTPLVSQNALDPIREAQLENPVYPEDDEDALTEEEYNRQEMDSHLHNV